MKTKGFLLLVFVCLSFLGKAQHGSPFGVIPKSGPSLKAFIPAGCDTLGTAIGDLNKDGMPDLAVAIYDKAEADSMDNPRLLLVLFKTAEGYMLAGRSEQILLCKGCGGMFGDPFAGIEIKKGVLGVDHYGGSAWRWSNTLSFRYQNNGFYLIGKRDYSYWDVNHCDKYNEFAGTDIEETNFVTGDHFVKKISENCKMLANKKNKIKIKPLAKLENYKNDN